jgi:putative ABC transport system permease protein
VTRTALAAILSHWRRRPLQLLTLVTGLALATALWTAVQALNAEARASYGSASTTLGQTPLEELTGEITAADYVALRRAGWLVTPEIEGRITAGLRDMRLLGIDPITAPPGPGIPALEDDDTAAFLTGEGLVFAPPEAVADLEATPGLPEIRVSPNLGSDELLTDIATAARILERGDRLDRLRVLPDQPVGRPPLDDVVPGLTRTQPEDEADIAQLTDSFHLNLTVFGLLSFAVGLFIVHASVGLAFEQRRGTFRTMRAVGVPLGRLVALLVGEALILALLGGLLGVALGYVLAGLLMPGVAMTLSGLYGADLTGGLSLRPSWVLMGLGIAVAGALVGSAQAMWRLHRLPILAGPQPRAWGRASTRELAFQGGAAAGLLALSGLIALVGEGLMAGFVLLGCLVLGAALGLPLLLWAALGVAQRLAKGVVAEWFVADTRQQLPGLSLALMALMLALTTNIGVGTMVGSFRQTFTGWLDQRLAAELYVTVRTPAEGERLLAFLEPRVDAILPIVSAESRIGGLPAEVFGVVDHPTYRENWPLLSEAPDVWDRLAAGEGAMLNEQTARRMDLAVGDTVALAAGWDAEILAVYSDYGNPAGQAIVSLPELEARFGAQPALRFGLRTGEDTAALVDEIVAFGLPRENMIDQATVKSFSLRVFDQTFRVTGALNLLTFGVAGFALLTSFLTLASMRLPQLAPVWALGLTRGRLARLELWRTLLLAALTAVAALPVGLVLAWALLAVVNVQAFGWRLPLAVFPLEWLRLMALAVVAAALAALVPVRRLATMPPRALLQVFAHER